MANSGCMDARIGIVTRKVENAVIVHVVIYLAITSYHLTMWGISKGSKRPKNMPLPYTAV